MLIAIIAAVIFLIFGFVVFRGAPYVPSHVGEVKGAFDHLYDLNAKSVLVDVGSGDGLILRLAAARGARAIGIELNPVLVLITRLLSLSNNRVSVRLGDFWLCDLPKDTTVVYAFSVSRDAKKLAVKMQREAERLDRSLDLITYGADLKDRKIIKTYRGHRLYTFDPLHGDEA